MLLRTPKLKVGGFICIGPGSDWKGSVGRRSSEEWQERRGVNGAGDEREEARGMRGEKKKKKKKKKNEDENDDDDDDDDDDGDDERQWRCKKRKGWDKYL